MKRILTVLLTVLLVSISAQAQDVWCHFGVQGGVTLNRFTTDLKSDKPGWHAGVSLLVKMPAFFAIQPAVQFERSNAIVPATSGESSKIKVNTINVPIAVQWGPDLGFCRIFVEAVPYFDFNLSGHLGDSSIKDSLTMFQFGTGLGGGIDIWRFQLSARYNWTFGDWQKIGQFENPFGPGKSIKQGVTVTLAYFFN